MTDETIAFEDKTQAAIEAGLRAARALEVMAPVDAALKADLTRQWERCQSAAIREALWQQVNGINAARGHLRAQVNAGQEAEARLEKLRAAKVAETAGAPFRFGRRPSRVA